MVFWTSSPSAMARLTSAVSSGSGMGASWTLNFSSSSPSLHMVDQKSKGRGPICRIRIFRKVRTTLHTAKKSQDPLLKHRVVEPAVGQVSKGHSEPPQHLAGGKETALGVPESGAIRGGPLIQRPPEQHRHIQVLGQPGADILSTEIAVGQQQAVHFFCPELLQNLEPVVLVIEQPFFIDVINVHKVHAQLPEPVRSEPRYLTASGALKILRRVGANPNLMRAIPIPRFTVRYPFFMAGFFINHSINVLQNFFNIFYKRFYILFICSVLSN